MKIFKSIALAAAVIVAFLSCQKEISFDTGGKSIGTFLKDAGGDCAPANVNGIFKQDTALALNANYIDVQVNVTTPGTFDIKSDTVNGYSFSKTGSVAFGNNTIRLYASGKPIVAGTNTFTIIYGTSICSFDIIVTGSGVLPAKFTLGGAPLLCTNAITGGNYNAGSPLTPANTLAVEINASTGGTYIINAITTNGFSFSGSGVIPPGVQSVILTGTGTPTKAEISLVTVTGQTSTCTFPITVLPALPQAVFTLAGAPNNCTGAVVNGVYAAGVATSASNTITLTVNVTTAGLYTITTNTANGISFSKTGVFTNTGVQTVVLSATGTPAAAGAFDFTPSASGSSCKFSVTCTATPPVPNGDYLPLTANSWWSYDYIDNGVPVPDTSLNLVIGTKTYGGNSYTEIETSFNLTPVDTVHFRKSGNDYYRWGEYESFSNFFTFDNTQFADFNFLRENATTGTTWSSAVLSGTSNGMAANLRYDFKIENANTTILVNGKNYTNVIYMSVAVQISTLGLPYTKIENNQFYFSKGIGLVKTKYVEAVGGTVLTESNIRNYKVF
jgi:hypothetical protein